MALTVKHLNTDATFLLSFEPIITSSAPGLHPKPFRVLLDPWITGPSKIFHSKISITTHREPACISSLRELPEPDLIIISQHKSDHCNEATLKQLPPTGTKTLIVAEPNAARVIRSWKYFDRDNVRVVPRWDDPRLTGRQCVVRVPVPPLVDGGEAGEVTVAYIPQRRDITGLHAAIGITYRPPPMSSAPLSTSLKRLQIPSPAGFLTPPATPKSYRSFSHLPSALTSNPTCPPAHRPYASRLDSHLTAATPPTPTSPGLSLRSVRSFSSIPFSRQSTLTTTSSFSTAATTHVPHQERTLSVLFSPHGISYPGALASYASAHLAAEAALPLTALLHCFDAVSNPWWLGGNILLGAPAGQEICTRLGARAWISAHDGDKEVKGLATRLLRTRRFRREEVCECVGSPTKGPVGHGGEEGRKGHVEGEEGEMLEKTTEVLALGNGDEVVLSCDGVWNVEGGKDAEERGLGSIGIGLPPMVEVKEAEGGFLNFDEVMAAARA